jgi:hypothetical protein
LPPCGAEAVSAIRSQRTPALRLVEARPTPKRVVLPLMNEAKKPPSSEGDGVHSREPRLFIADALAAGVRAMIAGQLGDAN